MVLLSVLSNILASLEPFTRVSQMFIYILLDDLVYRCLNQCIFTIHTVLFHVDNKDTLLESCTCELIIQNKIITLNFKHFHVLILNTTIYYEFLQTKYF
jgi:hypothetical protein